MKRILSLILVVCFAMGTHFAGHWSMQTAFSEQVQARTELTLEPSPAITETPSATPAPTPSPSPIPSPCPTVTPQPSASPTPTPCPTEEPMLTANPEITGRASEYQKAMGLTYSDLVLAAKVAYLEARGKGEQAYRAVLCVIYNRCMAPRFGGGVTDIETEVYRKGQFSVIHHKKFETMTPPEEIVDMARSVFLYGELSIPENVLFFCAQRLGENWGGRKLYKNIGGNLFFYGRTEP